jgi:hypothetical protein
MAEQLTRGDLPHWYMPGHAHFVTYRLSGSIPAQILDQLRLECMERLNRKLPPGADQAEYRSTVHKIMFGKYDGVLDTGSHDPWLAIEPVCKIIRENLYHPRGTKYELLAYTIMPNHVHLLIQPFESALMPTCGTPTLAASATTDGSTVGASATRRSHSRRRTVRVCSAESCTV